MLEAVYEPIFPSFQDRFLFTTVSDELDSQKGIKVKFVQMEFREIELLGQGELAPSSERWSERDMEVRAFL